MTAKPATARRAALPPTRPIAVNNRIPTAQSIEKPGKNRERPTAKQQPRAPKTSRTLAHPGGNRTARQGLSPEQYRQLLQWFRQREEVHCDRRPDPGSSTGKLDFLFEEAENPARNRHLRQFALSLSKHKTG